MKLGIVDTLQPDRRIIKEFMKNTMPQQNSFDSAEPKSYSSFREPSPLMQSFFEKHAPKQMPQSAFDKSMQGRNMGVSGQKELQKPEQADVESAENALTEKQQTSFEMIEQTGIFEDAVAEVCGKAVPIKIAGQVFDTYIVAQKGEQMYMIDQHAAHERKRFEMLKKDYVGKKASGQMLLTPIVLDVDSIEVQAVKENAQLLSDMGFEMEEFGRGSVIIRETPLVGDENEIKSLALEIIAILKDGRPVGLLSFEERLLDMVSCKYAIKANKSLSYQEMEALVKDVEMLEEDGITTCPHGRPIKITFTKREIEKMFKRIV